MYRSLRRSLREGGFGNLLETQLVLILILTLLAAVVYFVLIGVDSILGAGTFSGRGRAVYALCWAVLFSFSVAGTLQEMEWPTTEAKLLMKRFRFLGHLNALAWLLLGLGSILGTFFGLLYLFKSQWLALVGLPLGCFLAHLTSIFGWTLSELASPEKYRELKLHETPETSDKDGEAAPRTTGCRVPLELSPRGRMIDRGFRIGIPIVLFGALALGPLTAPGHILVLQGALLGLAAGAWSAYPFYLWGKYWSQRFLVRQLEWVRGSNLLQEHRWARGGAVVTELAKVSDIRKRSYEDGVFSFWLVGRQFRFRDKSMAKRLGFRS